jgi:phage I-like protein
MPPLSIGAGNSFRNKGEQEMMKEEFDKLVDFETRYLEYEEIEKEYLGTDIDKVKFAALWKKNGGIARLARMRTREIEELEAQVAKLKRERDESYTFRENTENDLHKKVSIVTKAYEDLKRQYTALEEAAETKDLEFGELVDAVRLFGRYIPPKTA